MFCRELVKDLRQASHGSDGSEFPSVIFFSQADVAVSQKFFDSRWPEARVVCDPERAYFDGFRIERAKLRQLAGPGVWWSALRAFGKGNGVGLPVGDPHVMPGMLLVDAPREPGTEPAILWSHEFEHAGDHPTMDQIAAAAAAVDRSGRVESSPRPVG